MVTHGNDASQGDPELRIRGFNGAMRGYAWKCLKISTPATSTPCCFNGAMRGYAWKCDVDLERKQLIVRLQWSHAWLRMEISEQHAMQLLGDLASMEPCVVTHGNEDGTQLPADRILASMEPCVVTHGNLIGRRTCM